MTRVNWATIGERYYESGIDRGMLYVEELPGVAWNGLISVDENPSGGQVKKRFYDGVNYLNTTSPEAYAATITAFLSPPEFDLCDGIESAALGLYATAQRRRTFGLSYRTRIGNDVNGTDHAYKIHLVYHALAEPATKRYQTISANPEATSLSWSIVAKPILFGENKRSAHYIIDSREADALSLMALEDILYGSDVEVPRLPDLYEISTILNDVTEFQIIDNLDGTYTAIGNDAAVSLITPGIFQLTHDEGVIPIDDATYTATSA